MVTSTGSSAQDLQGDVDQHAVAQLDGVVEPIHELRGLMELGKVREDPFAADAGAGIFPEEGQSVAFARPGSVHRHEWIHASGGENDDARGLEPLRDVGRHAGVLDPGRFRGRRRAEFLTGEVENVRGGRQRRHLSGIGEITRERTHATGLQFGPRLRAAEP
jgi:hypothetical protein